ncbi:hypothetical protein G7046_g7018 [Stylonectria norvegica]|nr:hypothetical protein G7046_g7018 [Stylonectria norvegica]
MIGCSVGSPVVDPHLQSKGAPAISCEWIDFSKVRSRPQIARWGRALRLGGSQVASAPASSLSTSVRFLGNGRVSQGHTRCEWKPWSASAPESQSRARKRPRNEKSRLKEAMARGSLATHAPTSRSHIPQSKLISTDAAISNGPSARAQVPAGGPSLPGVRAGAARQRLLDRFRPGQARPQRPAAPSAQDPQQSGASKHGNMGAREVPPIIAPSPPVGTSDITLIAFWTTSRYRNTEVRTNPEPARRWPHLAPLYSSLKNAVSVTCEFQGIFSAVSLPEHVQRHPLGPISTLPSSLQLAPPVASTYQVLQDKSHFTHGDNCNIATYRIDAHAVLLLSNAVLASTCFIHAPAIDASAVHSTIPLLLAVSNLESFACDSDDGFGIFTRTIPPSTGYGTYGSGKLSARGQAKRGKNT